MKFEGLYAFFESPYTDSMMLKNEKTGAEDFDEFYSKADPWGVRNSIQDLARIKKFSQVFKNAQFIYGLDIGCGEGHFTSTMDFVKNLTAIDISEVALKRAKLDYPKINFITTDLRDLSAIESNKFDFISCLEAIYYLDGEVERKKALREIKSKGKDNCVYCFSVVTIGENEHRKYFTTEGAMSFFTSEFNIINQFPISLSYPKPTFFLRVINKIRRIFSRKKYNIENYLEDLNSAAPQSTYQTVFILTKKSEPL